MLQDNNCLIEKRQILKTIIRNYLSRKGTLLVIADYRGY